MPRSYVSQMDFLGFTVGGEISQDSASTFSTILENNSSIPFVDRINNPQNYPYPDYNEDGSISTHLLSAEIDEKGDAYVFPTKVYQDKGYKTYTEDERFQALDDAKALNNVIKFNTINEAVNFSENYKTDNFKKYYRRKSTGEDSNWLEEVTTGVGPNIVDSAKQAGYGILNAVTESTAPLHDIIEKYTGQSDINDAFFGTKDDVTNRRSIIEKLEKEKQKRTPVNLSLTQQGIRGAMESAPLTAAAMITTLVTKSPTLGLSIMGGYTASLEYDKARQEGKNISESLMYGTVQGNIEAWTEKLGLGPLMKIFKGGGQNAVKNGMSYVVREITGENAAAFGQSMVSWGAGLDEVLSNRQLSDKDRIIIQAQRQYVATIAAAAMTSTTIGSIEGGRRIIDKSKSNERKLADEMQLILDSKNVNQDVLRQQAIDMFKPLIEVGTQRDVPITQVGSIEFATNEELTKYFKHVAQLQRFTSKNDSEHIMVEYQKAMGGGVMDYNIEHAGDLLYRMTHQADWTFDFEGVAEKVDHLERTFRNNLSSTKYGFHREFLENLYHSRLYDKHIKEGKSESESFELTYKVATDLLTKYGEAHSKLPVYNKVQWIAREIPIALSQFDYVKTYGLLGTLKEILESGSFSSEAGMIQKDDSGNVIEYTPPESIRNIQISSPNIDLINTQVVSTVKAEAAWKKEKEKNKQDAIKYQVSDVIDDGTSILTTEEAIKEARKIPFFNALPLNRMNTLMTEDGRIAFGSYYKGIISFVKNPKNTTLPHETFHAFTDIVLSSKQKNKMYGAVRVRDNINKDDIAIEETLAEEFAVWFRGGKAPVSTKEKTFRVIKNWMLQLTGAVKDSEARLGYKFNDTSTKKQAQVDNLFIKLMNPKLANTRVKTNLEDFNNLRVAYQGDPVEFTTKIANALESLGEKEIKKERLINLKNSLKKHNLKGVELRLIDATLNLPQFANSNKINIQSFIDAMEYGLLNFSIERTDTNSTYGLERIGHVVPPNSNDNKTVLIRTDFGPGSGITDIKSHFIWQRPWLDKDKMSIEKVLAGTYTDMYGNKETIDEDIYLLVNKEENPDGVLTAPYFKRFTSYDEGINFLKNKLNVGSPNYKQERNTSSVFGHFRYLITTDKIDGKKTFNVLEYQSDLFQRKLEILLKNTVLSNEEIAELKENKSKDYRNLLANLEEYKKAGDKIKRLVKVTQGSKQAFNYLTKQERIYFKTKPLKFFDSSPTDIKNTTNEAKDISEINMNMLDDYIDDLAENERYPKELIDNLEYAFPNSFAYQALDINDIDYKDFGAEEIERATALLHTRIAENDKRVQEKYAAKPEREIFDILKLGDYVSIAEKKELSELDSDIDTLRTIMKDVDKYFKLANLSDEELVNDYDKKTSKDNDVIDWKNTYLMQMSDIDKHLSNFDNRLIHSKASAKPTPKYPSKYNHYNKFGKGIFNVHNKTSGGLDTDILYGSDIASAISLAWRSRAYSEINSTEDFRKRINDILTGKFLETFNLTFQGDIADVSSYINNPSKITLLDGAKQPDITEIESFFADLSFIENTFSPANMGLPEIVSFASNNLEHIRDKLDRKLTLQDQQLIKKGKQLRGLRHNYYELILKTAMREAAIQGADVIRFPTPLTLATIQRYITPGIDAGSFYKPEDMKVGLRVNTHLGEPGIVSFLHYPNANTTIPDAMDITVPHPSALIDTDIQADGSPIPYHWVTKSIEEIKKEEFQKIQETNEKVKNKETLTESELKLTTEYSKFLYLSWKDFNSKFNVNIATHPFSNNNFLLFKNTDDKSRSEIITTIDKKGTLHYTWAELAVGTPERVLQTISNIETFVTKSTKKGFKLSDVTDAYDDPQRITHKYGDNTKDISLKGINQNISSENAQKYMEHNLNFTDDIKPPNILSELKKKGEYYTYIAKRRKAISTDKQPVYLKEVWDRNGFSWYESNIVPADRGPIEMFQTGKTKKNYRRGGLVTQMKALALSA